MLLQTIFLALFSGAFGILLCFGGYRFFTVMLPIWAFFGGLWLGAKGVFILLGGGFLGTATGLTVGLVLGILMAIFSWQFYVFGLSLVGAIIGAWLGSGLMSYLGYETGIVHAFVALACAIALGILTYTQHWQDELITGLSAIAGANSIVLAILLLLGRVSITGVQGAGSAVSPILRDSPGWLFLWLGVAIAGIIVQRRTFRAVTFSNKEFFKYWS
ncbi:MAG TPA: hypothetical protein IGS53_19890 [Leptolyngbyaceae cyanobacterium M33_DOE_097]|uniref:DUF4203 domain-containing protein n=1 Tax=Oscillatoriales cyanobacterium SpSt-418 TaxID=2282169 RepID=A0A7C3KD82_9CYAN|nr:hypothetical protein [Leptolyngbyaceae cyanobacterium M33_DOE_097]